MNQLQAYIKDAVIRQYATVRRTTTFFSHLPEPQKQSQLKIKSFSKNEKMAEVNMVQG
jgi:hypothetical protein